MLGRDFDANALNWLREQGLIAFDDAHVRLTRTGRVVANTIAAELSFAND